MVLVPGYCTIVPRNLSVIFHRWKGFQWVGLDTREPTTEQSLGGNATEPRSCDASFNRQRVRGLMEYKTVTAGTREDGGQGVIEDSVELVAVLDAQVNDAIRLGWRPVGVVVTGPDGRLNQTMVRVR